MPSNLVASASRVAGVIDVHSWGEGREREFVCGPLRLTLRVASVTCLLESGSLGELSSLVWLFWPASVLCLVPYDCWN